jgi:transcriptional regulator with XRE-family HTH domain
MAGNSVTLTPELSKRARRELGLSQNDVIKASGIQAYKLKQWEGRGLSIELADMRKLSDFYEAQGVDLAELSDHMRQAGAAVPDDQRRPALQAGFTYTPRPGFIISDQLAPELVDSLMERMEVNDDRIAELTAAAFNTGFFGDPSGDTEAKARELLGTMAENHVIFRCLQGRNIVSVGRDEPKTIGEYLGQMLQASPVMPLIAATDNGKPTKVPSATAAAEPQEQEV